MRLSRLAVLPLALVGLLAGCSRPHEAPRQTEAGPMVTVYKTPTCGCCTLWEDHLRAHGFQVDSRQMNDLSPIKEQYGIPHVLGSCHTGVVEGYAVEGHVPADVIRRLLAERPAVQGIAVPGMPMGSPGMEGPFSQPYEVYTFRDGAPVEVFAVR